MACTIVERGPSAPAAYSTSAGVPPNAARHSAFSSGCSDRCAWTGAPCACDHAITSGTWSGETARTEWIAAPSRACGATMPSESRVNPETRSAQAAAEPSPNRSCTPASGSGSPPGRNPPAR